MGFQSIRRIIPTALREAGISHQVTVAQVLSETKAAITRLWGEDKAAYVEPISFAGGVLKIGARSTVALQEIKLWSARLQNEVNRTIGSKTIHEVRSVEWR